MTAPKFTKEQRAQFVRLLEGAKGRLWDGRARYANKESCVCHALPIKQGRMALKQEINRRLGRHLYVTSWLVNQPGFTDRPVTTQEFQAYRLAWINKLIEEFSA